MSTQSAQSARGSDPYLNRQIRDFVIEECIGRGGMALVYRARQLSVRRDVAVKIVSLAGSANGDDTFRQRFAQEAKIIASLEHIHILPIYDYGIVGDELAFIVMRLLRGGSLSEKLTSGPLALDHAVELFTQVARGLAYAHGKGVIHRDLKPGNILLDDGGNAFLTDFGLAKLLEDPLDLTRSGQIVGTPVYMSPEQLRGEVLDVRSDIYSLGCILYAMLVGRPPIDPSRFNVVSVIFHQLETEPPAPRTLNPAIPAAVDAVIMKALSKEPDDRFDQVEALVNALHQATGRRSSVPPPAATAAQAAAPLPTAVTVVAQAAERVLSSSSVSTPVTVTAPRTMSRRVVLAGLAMAAAVVLGLIGVLAALGSRPEVQTVPVVLLGQQGSFDDTAPGAAEIAAAQRRLGDGGMIAYVNCSMSTEYHAAQAREMRDFAAEHGLELRIYDSGEDSYEQITQIERARVDGAQALIVCPLDPVVLQDSLKSIQQMGLPLVLMSGGFSDTYGGVQIAGDDYAMGYAAGLAGADLINQSFDGQGRVVILDYPDMPILVTRAQGLEDGLLERAPEAEVVAHRPGGTPENGEAGVGALLEQGVAFNAILSINDAGAIGAVRALEAAGVSPESVVISSVDAEAVVREYIRQGYYFGASVEIDRALFSRAAVDAIVRLLGGGAVPQTILVAPQSVVVRTTAQSTAEAHAD